MPVRERWGFILGSKLPVALLLRPRGERAHSISEAAASPWERMSGWWQTAELCKNEETKEEKG